MKLGKYIEQEPLNLYEIVFYIFKMWAVERKYVW